MRVLCTCSPAHGHFHPMVPLARALAQAGHEVAFATAQDFCSRVEKSGFRALAAGLAQPRRGEELRKIIAHMMTLPPPARAKAGFPRVFGEIGAPAMLPDLTAVLASFRPQLLVHDTSELAGPIAATAAGIPYVNHSFGQRLPDEIAQFAAEAVAPLWRAAGLEEPPFAGLYRHLYLDICPPSLQSPHIREIPVAQRLRPVPFDAAAGEDAPAWLESLGPKPTIYVTMGTVFNEALPLFRTILDGLRELPANVIVTVGSGGDPSALGPQPDHIHVERYVPQTMLFARCHAVVSHGGSGTMLSALGAGLPLLMIPQGADQFINADRCVATGVGRSLAPPQVTAEAIRRDVSALLDEPHYRESARRVKREIESMPTPQDVVRVLEDLAARQEPLSAGADA